LPGRLVLSPWGLRVRPGPPLWRNPWLP